MGRKKKTPEVINVEELEIKNEIEIDYDKLAFAIVRAKQIEKEIEKQANADALTKWREKIGYKEHSDKRGVIKALMRLGNRIKVVCKVMFLPKEQHFVASPTSAFVKILTSSFFVFIQYLLTLLSVGFFLAMFYHPGLQYNYLTYIVCVGLSLSSFMFAGIFRVMALEIEKMSNREQVLGVFTAVIAVIPLIEKIVGLIRG